MTMNIYYDKDADLALIGAVPCDRAGLARHSR